MVLSALIFSTDIDNVPVQAQRFDYVKPSASNAFQSLSFVLLICVLLLFSLHNNVVFSHMLLHSVTPSVLLALLGNDKKWHCCNTPFWSKLTLVIYRSCENLNAINGQL